ncbi:MAG TPA: exodeoxyribonuclease VII large subunit [Methanosarcinaceae archaeon]|nr:exodeoxyribonuclease VII large subunit [Methanosarcinaceae archaeon]
MGIYTVSEVNNRIKHILTNDPKMSEVWVRGEISNLTKHSSGHYYFTIKDRNSQLNCVSFRSTNRILKFEPETSMKVLVFGSIDVYTVRGLYQLRVFDMRPDGIGELYKAFEQLKKKLEEKGFFEGSHKKPIPRYPKKIGIVTSPTGAAIHDILNVAKRRCPVDILVAPALVQGERSAQDIAASIEMLNQTDVDVIIIGRGGGSLEDLWSFNEEIVARAIFNSNIPIVSAVGHETDYTIADFTADIRAPTPSAAAELVVPNRIEIRRHIESLSTRMEQAAIYKISGQAAHLDHLRGQIDPDRLNDLLRQNQQRVDEITSRMEYSIKTILNMKGSSLKICAGRLDAISPLKTIERGYSITIRADDRKIVGNISDVKKGDGLEIIVKDGAIECSVDSTK